MPVSSLAKVINGLQPSGGAALEFWNHLKSLKNVFDRPRSEDAREDLRDFLPMRAFRGPGGAALVKNQTRVFRSSGTSQQDRSHSGFTPDGLLTYKAASLKTFACVLEGLCGENYAALRGFSLVPTPAVWESSSLAQMVSWIGEIWPVTFLDGSSAESSWNFGDGPVFVFGTAFHFVNLFDGGFRTQLPAGSVIIETGGTKGKSRSVTRQDLYDLIASMFGVEERSIASEYGMCELASQAYDWIGAEETDRRLPERSFRFPSWVRPLVMEEAFAGQSAGKGILTLRDGARTDLLTSLQTEDLAELTLDGSFKLLGRVPTAPLKGCSMLAEVVREDPSERQRTSEISRVLPPHATGRGGWVFDENTVGLRVEAVNRLVKIFLNDPQVTQRLGVELGSFNAATSALNDIARMLPKTSAEWLKAARAATVDGGPRRWLLILPSSHPIAGLQPVVFGLLAGLHLRVRVPREFDRRETFLRMFLDAAQREFPGALEFADATLRLAEPTTCLDRDAVMVFGDTQTIRDIERAVVIPVQGFGSAIAVALLDEDDLALRPALIARDAFGLSQQGCMSVRIAGVVSERSLQGLCAEASESLAHSFMEFWGGPLGLEANAALCLEESILAAASRACFTRRRGYPLFAFCRGGDGPIADCISPKAFVLPLVTLLKDPTQTAAFLASIPDLRLVTAGQSLHESVSETLKTHRFLSQDIELRQLGDAQAPPWNGSHQGRGLFQIRKICAS